MSNPKFTILTKNPKFLRTSYQVQLHENFDMSKAELLELVDEFGAPFGGEILDEPMPGKTITVDVYTD